MKQATLFKFGVTRNVEHRGNIVKLSGPSFTEEKLGIYSCICEKHFKKQNKKHLELKTWYFRL